MARKREKRQAKATRQADKPAPSKAQEAPDPPYRFWSEELAAWRSLLADARPNTRYLIGLLLFAACIRFLFLSNASLWMDEIAILNEAYSGQYSLISFRAHAAHLLPTSWMMHLFGQTTFGVRFWSASLGSLAVPAIFLWGLWTSGRRVAFAAASLAAVNCFLVMYAQDAAYYGDVTFYMALQMCCYTVFFRGAPYSSLLLFFVISVVSFKTHPITAIPTSILFGGMLLGAFLFKEVRDRFIAWKANQWLGRPAVPAVAAALIFGAPLWLPAVQRIGPFFSRVITPGETSLTNVTFSLRFFQAQLTAFGVDFHRMSYTDHALAWIVLAAALYGLVWGIVCWKRTKRSEVLAFLGAAVLIPIASYAILFSINLNRNFNIRYFIYIVPLYIGLIAHIVYTADKKDSPSVGWLKKPTGIIWLVLFLVMGGSTATYLFHDKANYRDGAAYLAENYDGQPIITTTRNDKLEADYYLEQADLPTESPSFTFLNQPAYEDLYAYAFPYMMHGVDDAWIISAWRYVRADRLYAIISALPEEFAGFSKWNAPHDFRLYRWIYGDSVLYANAAIIAGTGKDHFVPFAGAWFHIDSAGARQSLEGARGTTSLQPGTAYFPELPPTLELSFDEAINIPEHTKQFPAEIDGRPVLRNERDGSYDYLLYVPPEGRYLSIHVAPPSADDPILKDNARPLPDGMLVAVAIDGRHQGFWPVEGAGMNTITPSLDLEPGNHRITISGLVPRSIYTPFFPWYFGGINWSVEPASEPQPSLEANGAIQLSSGWNRVPTTADDQGNLARGWAIQGNYPATIDPDIMGPAGDPAIRIEIPSGNSESLMLLSPPMPVKQDTLAVYTMHIRIRGLDHHELTPIHLFVNSQGETLPGIFHANGPNIRGTTYGKGWIRRQVTTPVPPGAVALIGGVISYPLKGGETEGATVWFASFHSPGTEIENLSDIQLPDNYFGFHEAEANVRSQ